MIDHSFSGWMAIDEPPAAAAEDRRAPGKRTLTMSLPPSAAVQRRALRAPAGADDVRGAAAEGVASTTTAMPHAAAIQAAFGDAFDVGGITAHVGGSAADACDAMGAAAYATGAHAVFAAAPDLHTAAHEAAHVVQQAHGVHLYGGVGDHDDAYERHADAVADRVVAGRSASDLLWALPDRAVPRPSTVIAGANVQRKLTFKGKDLPTTWKQIKKKYQQAEAEAKKVYDAAETKLGGSADPKRLEKVWGKLAGKKSKQVLDLETQAKDVIAALVKGYNRSQSSSSAYQERKEGQQAITADLRANHPELKQTKNARNPQLISEDMAEFEFDGDMPQHQREQGHLSSVLLDHFGGEEAQAALAKDKTGVVTSTNTNDANKAMAALLQDRAAIEALVIEVAKAHKLATVSRDQAMQDHVLRHAMKLFDRLWRVLNPDAKVDVPSTKPVFDGQHAEIRIEKSQAWDAATHFLPTGTKYPCTGCELYFNDQGHPVSLRMGPMWLTDAALSSQLHDHHRGGGRLSTLDKSESKEVSSELAMQYDQLPGDVEMGYTKLDDGSLTAARVPDSDSELEEEDFTRIRKDMLSFGASESKDKGESKAKPKAKAKAKAKAQPASESKERGNDKGKKRKAGDSVDSTATRALQEADAAVRDKTKGGKRTNFWRAVDRYLKTPGGDVAAAQAALSDARPSVLRELYRAITADYDLDRSVADDYDPAPFETIVATLLATIA